MPAIHFDITGDNDNIIKTLQETVDKLDQFSTISKRFSEAGVDFSNTEQAIKGVEKYIEGLNGAVDGCADKIEELNGKIAEASANGDSTAVTKYKEELEETISTQGQLKDEVESSKGALDLLKQSFDDTAESAGKTEGVMVKLLGGQKNYNEIISYLPEPLKRVVTGLNGMVKAARAFIATPLGAALTPLIIAFSALYKWLNSTAEGQQKLAKISGYLKGVLAGLQQVVFDVGRTLYNAFTHPQEAINNLWQSLKRNIIERLNASSGVIVNFGKMIGRAFSGKWDEAKEAADEMRKSFNQLVDNTPIVKMATAVTERVNGIHEIGKAQSQLSARENKLHRDRTAWMTEEAELDKQIAEQRNKMRMGSKTDREAAAAKMQELINKKTERNVELAREEYEIKKASNALTDSSQEDLDEEERLHARITQLETQGVTQKGFALRIQDSMNRQLGISSEKLSELIEKENELLDSLTEKQGQQGIETAALGISAMVDGFDKEMAERENEHQQRMAAIEKENKERIEKIKDFQKAEYKARHGTLSGFKFDENTEAMAVANEIHDQDLANEEERERQALSQVYKKYIDEYKGFIGEWEDLTDKFNNDRKALTMSGAILDNPGLWDEVGRKEREAFESLAEKWASSGQDKALKAWFDSLGSQTYDDLLDMLTMLEVEFQNLGDSLPDDEAKKLSAQIILVKKALSGREYGDDFVDDLNKDIERKAIPNWTELNKILSDTASLFKQAGKTIGGVFGEALGMAGDFVTSLGKIRTAVEAFKEAKAAKDSIGMMTSGLSIVGVAASVASEVVGKVSEAKKYMDELDVATEAYARTLKSIEDSRVLQSLTNAFGTDTLGQFRKQMSIVSDANKSIKDLFSNYTNKSFLNSYMGTGFQKALGFGKQYILDMEEIFDESGNLLGENLREWYEKYGEGMTAEGKKFVESLLFEFDRQQDAIKGIASYLGGLFGDVASDIASDMVDQFIATGDAIQDMSKYMDDFAVSVAKSVIQSKLMGEIFTEDNQQVIADLLAAGKTSDAVNTFNGLLEKAKELAPGLNDFLAGIGLSGMSGSSNVDASSKGFATMSQDTATELNGRFTAVQISNEIIAQGVTTGVATLLTIQSLITADGAAISDIRDMHVLETGYLADIAKQTKPIPSMVETLDKIQRNTAKL